VTAFLLDCWYMAAWSRDLAVGAVIPVRIAGHALALYRGEGGMAHALADRCPHRLAPLSRGEVEGDDLRCLYHGLRFSGGGRCTEIPGLDRIPAGLAVPSYRVEERHSALWVWPGDPDGADPGLIPAFVGLDDPAWSLRASQIEVEASHVLINDNLLDLSHLAYVHRNSFGGGERVEPGKGFTEQTHAIERIERGLRITHWMPEAVTPPYTRYATGPLADIWIRYDFVAPGVFMLVAAMYPPGSTADGNGLPPGEPLHMRFTCQAVTPMSERRARYFFATGPWARDAANSDLFLEVATRAFAEDKAMIEAQQLVIDANPDIGMKPMHVDKAPLLFAGLMKRLIEEQDMRRAGP